MNVISKLYDNRIKSTNVLIEITIGDYIKIARQILNNNPYQRRKIKTSSTVYSLLRDDLKSGCIIPPIVLALDNEVNIDSTYDEILKIIEENVSRSLILDGLQRTNNIIEVEDELLKNSSSDILEKYYKYNLRCEFYLGINKVGVLYRMLTLNTGQTPMTLRQQIEILYSDLIDVKVNGIKLIREVDDKPVKVKGEYSFRDAIEGFTSYLVRDYLSFDRLDLLENVKSLEKLSKETQGHDLFKQYLESYDKLINVLIEKTNDWHYSEELTEFKLTGEPFGKDTDSFFNKSQVMTGFGAAIAFLTDNKLINGFNDIPNYIDDIKIVDSDKSMNALAYRLDEIRKKSTKIGNAQRAYFFYFFRELFNTEGDYYLNFDEVIENAYTKYKLNS